MNRGVLLLLLTVGACNRADEPVPCEACETIGPSTRFARLTHTQYENATRDLLGLNERAGFAGAFIGDVLSEGGFDNDGDQLQVGGDLWLDYQRAAERLAARVIVDPDLYRVVVAEDPRGGESGVDFEASFEGEGDEVTATTGRAVREGWILWSRGQLTATVTLPERADYAVRARVWADQAGPDLARMQLLIDGSAVLEADVEAVSHSGADELAAEVLLTAGEHEIGVAFLNDYYQEGEGDRNLYVDWVAIEGAAPAYTGDPPDEADIRAWIERLGSRAHRRPLTDDQVDAYVALFQAGGELEFTGDAFRDGAYTALQGMLQSPWFLYRTEAAQTQDDEGRIPLDAYDVASKLSFALTHSMPDAELWAAAADESLLTDAGYRAQVDRLLADEAAVEVVDHFHAQLLELDAYDNIYKAPAAYPRWTPALNQTMKAEALAFTRSVVFDDETVYDLFTSPRTYVDRDLAQVYGLSVDSETLVPVDLDAAQRAGVLTLSGFLASQAHASEVDSIHRGAFVNLRFLCSNLPPPPDVIPPLPEPVEGQTNRERVDAHTGQGTCGGGCHAPLINAVGFAFENYDALGQWQTTDAGKPIDSSGRFQFKSGAASWTTPVEFAHTVAESSDAHMCLTRNWMRYLHGRDTSVEDERMVDALGNESISQDLAIRAVIREIVTADSFRYRSPEVAQ